MSKISRQTHKISRQTHLKVAPVHESVLMSALRMFDTSLWGDYYLPSMYGTYFTFLKVAS